MVEDDRLVDETFVHWEDDDRPFILGFSEPISVANMLSSPLRKRFGLEISPTLRAQPPEGTRHSDPRAPERSPHVPRLEPELLAGPRC